MNDMLWVTTARISRRARRACADTVLPNTAVNYKLQQIQRCSFPSLSEYSKILRSFTTPHRRDGCRRGKVLSTVLFGVNVAELPLEFADDIKIYRKIKSDTDVERVNRALERIYEQSNIWKLPPAPEKSARTRLGGSECSARYSLQSTYLIGNR